MVDTERWEGRETAPPGAHQQRAMCPGHSTGAAATGVRWTSPVSRSRCLKIPPVQRESLGSAPAPHSFAFGPLLIPTGTWVRPKAPLPCSGLQQEHPTPYSQGGEGMQGSWLAAGATTRSTCSCADFLQQMSWVTFFMVTLSSHRSSDASPVLAMPRNTTKSLRFPTCS